MDPLVWTVYVDDNFNYRDEDERYCLGAFESYETALAACRKIVDGFLEANAAKAKTADDLYASYTSFGEDPWIQGPLPAGEEARFSGWAYARRRSRDLKP